MFESWLLMQLQKRTDVVHNSVGELEIDWIPWLRGDFFSFLHPFFPFCFHVWRPMPQESHLEKEKVLHYLCHRLLEQQSYGTLYRHNDPALNPKLNWCFICTRKRGYRSRLTLVTEVTGGIKNEHKVNCFIDISKLINM